MEGDSNSAYLEEGDRTLCNNYQRIALLSTAYMVFSKVLLNRIKLITAETVGECKAGFRKITREKNRE